MVVVDIYGTVMTRQDQTIGGKLSFFFFCPPTIATPGQVLEFNGNPWDDIKDGLHTILLRINLD